MRWVRPRSMWSHSCGGDEAGKQIVGEDAFRAFIAAVDGEGDALGEEGEIGGLLAALQFVIGQAGERFSQCLILGAQFTVGLAHLVECPIERIISEQRIRLKGLTGAHGLEASLCSISGCGRR